jgi:peptidoglycan/LPS O-acetylase OafA/YrhL
MQETPEDGKPVTCDQAAPGRAPAGSAPAPRATHYRVEHLDGLRAVAALFVVVVHSLIESNKRLAQPDSGHVHWYNFAFASVSVFIVLSGYCLMLPIVRGGVLDAKKFFKKRARRILPPYYAALGLSIAVIVARPATVAMSFFWQNATLSLHTGVIVSHLLLVHNLSTHWALLVNPSLWSIATEWQIYFLFPFLLWTERKGTALMPLLVAFAIAAIAIAAIGKVNKGVDPAQCQLLGLFAMGMLACRRSHEKPVSRRMEAWAVFAAVLFLLAAYHLLWLWQRPALLSIGAGVVAYLMLVACSHEDSLVRRVLEMRFLTWIGGFSYSLYLIHDPILAVIHLWTPYVSLVGIPVAVALAYCFYRIFEKPFMTHPR